LLLLLLVLFFILNALANGSQPQRKSAIKKAPRNMEKATTLEEGKFLNQIKSFAACWHIETLYVAKGGRQEKKGGT